MDDRSRYTLSQFSADAQVAVGLSSTLVDRLASDAPRQQELRRALEVVASLAAKSYPTVFPSAHQSLIDDIQCRLEVGIGGIQIHTHLKALSKASLGGVVQFAAASAGLCLVELLRGEDPGVKIMEIRLLQSKGGRSGEAATFPRQLNSAVIVLSDSRAAGKEPDSSGPIIRERMRSLGFDVVDVVVIPDDPEALKNLLLRFADERKIDCVVTTGGTGLGPRDSAPEVTRAIIDRDIPGVSEAIRSYGQKRMPFSMLSRGIAGVRGRTLILNLPGSPAGVAESLDAVMPELLHVFKMMAGEGHA